MTSCNDLNNPNSTRLFGVFIPLIASLNSNTMEFEAKPNQHTETVEKNNLEVLANMNSIEQEFGVFTPLIASLNSYKMEFEAKLNQLTETVEKHRLEALAKISQIALSSHASMNSTEQEPSCTIVFCGRSFYSGGPGPSGGAGVILLVEDGSVFCAFREGLGNQTSYVAEYRALILGLKKASMKGFKHIAVKGDSDFVINQFGKPWETTDLQLRNLCLEAMKLSKSFHSFSMEIIPMDDDNQAVVEAIKAINIGEGEVEEENLLNQ